MSEAAETCKKCNGTGRRWYPNGGPWGIGSHGRCDHCEGDDDE